MLELAKTIAWPLALVIITLTIRSIIKIVISRKAEVSFSYKDLFKFGARGPQAGAEAGGTPITPATAETPQVDQDFRETAEEKETTSGAVERKEDASRNSTELFTTKDPSALTKLFAEFRSDDSYQSDPDFWETFYVDRRREVGVANYIPELQSLASANPDWIWPCISLVREHRQLSDLESGEQALAEALVRSTSQNRKWVLREGIRLYFNLAGAERAFDFLHENLSKGISDEEKAALFESLAAECKRQSDTESYLLFKELELTFSPENHSARFDAAYEYGQHSRFPIPAYRHYRQVMRGASDWPGPPNNLGVLMGGVSSNLQNDFYERSVALGNRLAAANLAQKLVEAGFIGAAESLLQRFEGGDEYAENYARAKAQVLSARRALETERETLDAFVDTQFARYRAAVMDAFRSLCREGPSIPPGAFTTQDRSIQVYISKEGAACRMPFGTITLEGVAPRKANCFIGTLSSKTGGLLNSISLKILIVPISSNQMRMIQWPRSFSRDDPLLLHDLTRLEESPAIQGRPAPEVLPSLGQS